MDKNQVRDDLTRTLLVTLTKYALAKVIDMDDGRIVPGKDLQSLAEMVISRLSIENRIRLYVDVFCSEIEPLAQTLGEEAVAYKIKKAGRKT